MTPEKWKTASLRQICQNKWMSLHKGQVELTNDRTTIYGVCEFGARVGVLPFVDDWHVATVRQYRYQHQENHRWEMPPTGYTQ